MNSVICFFLVIICLSAQMSAFLSTVTPVIGPKPTYFSGRTKSWVDYDQAINRNGIFVDVDFSLLKCKQPPIVFTSLTGTQFHWDITGVSSIYSLTN